MAFSIDPSPTAGGVHNEVHATQQNQLGVVRQFSDGNSYIYLKGVASTAANDWVVFDETYQTTRTVAASSGPAAIAQAATIASTFGWYLYVGSGTAYVLSAAVSAATLYVNAQAGAAATAVVGNKAILNATNATAAASTAATVRINRPWVGDNTISA
jgi:hypothetical protein